MPIILNYNSNETAKLTNNKVAVSLSASAGFWLFFRDGLFTLKLLNYAYSIGYVNLYLNKNKNDNIHKDEAEEMSLLDEY